MTPPRQRLPSARSAPAGHVRTPRPTHGRSWGLPVSPRGVCS